MDVIKFDPVDSFLLSGRGRVYVGPCPLDGETDETNIRKCVGRQVEIHGVVYTITGVDTYAKLPPPRLGESVGLLVSRS